MVVEDTFLAITCCALFVVTHVLIAGLVDNYVGELNK